jgi:hypothetical protein
MDLNLPKNKNFIKYTLNSHKDKILNRLFQI